MKTLSMLILLSSVSVGCASTARLGRAGDNTTPRRGDVVVSGPAVRAVVAGPIAIHAYSGFAGGRLFVAERVTGTDSDCQVTGAGEGTGRRLPADRVQDVSVGAGQVACLSATAKRGFEMLWHARRDGAQPLVVADGR